MERILRQMALSEGGKRFLVNLWYGVVSSQLPPDSVLHLLSAIETAPEPPPSGHWHPYLKSLQSVIFADANRYQFVGPDAHGGFGQWMTVKSASDLVELIRAAPGRTLNEINEIFFPIDLKEPLRGRSDGSYRKIAEILSQPAAGLQFLLARTVSPGIPTKPAAMTPRPVPAWLSRWCTFREAFPGYSLPSNQCAGRVRDWLGLTHYGADEPLFAVLMRRPADTATLSAQRPTVLDGFDHPMFKHRTGRKYAAENCGTATDLDLIDAAPVDVGDLDGGPEVVSRGVWYDPVRFECVYLGKATPLNYYPFGDFHSRLIGNGATLDSILDCLIDKLRSP